MNDKEFAKRLAETKFIVDATSHEVQMLWERHSDESNMKMSYNGHEMPRFKWEQLNPGVSQNVGRFADMPVCISLFWYRIDGIMVMFCEPTSQVVDHRLIDEWLKNNCQPKWDAGTRVAHCNAENFHHVIHYIQDPEQR